MKTIIHAILYSATVLLFLIVGCKDNKEPVESGISGSIINISECKNFKSRDLKFDTPDTFSCAHFNYDASNFDLIINHINSGFNCCPGGIHCKVSTHNDTIIIKEFENDQGCDCNCLFDLDIKLQGVEQNKYTVKFIEPYAIGQEELVFEMDLTSINEGEFCIIRKGYPWGE